MSDNEKTRHILIFDDSIARIVEEQVLQASGFALEVQAFSEMHTCMQRYEELAEQKEEVVAILMEPILWFAAYDTPQEFANFFIEKGVPVICYSTNAGALVDLFAKAAGLESNLADNFEVSGIAGNLCKGDIEGLRDLLKKMKVI